MSRISFNLRLLSIFNNQKVSSLNLYYSFIDNLTNQRALQKNFVMMGRIWLPLSDCGGVLLKYLHSNV